ncbi:MAG TPA: glycosyltransferase family 4 protein [Mycobacteriales bacterium]|nr:glycosyltransferase family 4 protein [Mycobacteriales bacterium]
MRVLALTNLYPPHFYGGYELTCRDVLERWRARGHQVGVLTSRLPGAVDAPEDRNVWRRLRPYWDWEAASERRGSALASLLAETANRRHLRRAIRRMAPDVVSVWHLGGLSIGLLNTVEGLGLPMGLVVGDDWLCYLPGLVPWQAHARRSRLWRLAGRAAGLPTGPPTLHGSVAAFVSSFTAARTAACWPDLAGRVVPPGIDPVDFPAGGPSASPRRAWTGRLLYVGRVDPAKGAHTAVAAMRHLPADHTLTIIGGGHSQHRADLAAYARDLGLGERVQFDRCPRGELRGRYLAADVVVFPSEWDEPFGLVPLEAMACGRPVVATARGGSAEYLRDGDNCVVFPAGDAQALADAVRRLAADDALRNRVVAAGRTTAARYTVDRYADELESLHEEVLAARPGGPGGSMHRGGG